LWLPSGTGALADVTPDGVALSPPVPA
jgi:hypothetical protein